MLESYFLCVCVISINSRFIELTIGVLYQVLKEKVKLLDFTKIYKHLFSCLILTLVRNLYVIQSSATNNREL